MPVRIYRPGPAGGLQWVQPVDEADFDTVYRIEPPPLAGRWRPVRVRTIDPDERRKYRPADLPWLGSAALVLGEAAYGAVGAALEGAGELLDLEPDDGSGRLWLFDAHVVGALDEEASELVRFASTGRVMRLLRPAFRPGSVAGLAAFRVPQTGELFVGGDVVDAVEAAGLTGTTFDLVWEE